MTINTEILRRHRRHSRGQWVPRPTTYPTGASRRTGQAQFWEPTYSPTHPRLAWPGLVRSGLSGYVETSTRLPWCGAQGTPQGHKVGTLVPPKLGGPTQLLTGAACQPGPGPHSPPTVPGREGGAALPGGFSGTAPVRTGRSGHVTKCAPALPGPPRRPAGRIPDSLNPDPRTRTSPPTSRSARIP